MKVAIFLGHPAHYHYFKNVAKQLVADGHEVKYVIKQKDILTKLLDADGISYTTIREGRSNSKWALVKSVLTMEWGMIRFLRKNHINVLVGCSLSFAARIFTKTQIITTGEDDAAVIPMFAKLVYPYTNVILSPRSCNNGRWENKSVKYDGFMKLAYLHPNQFTPSVDIVRANGVDPNQPYFLLRFASLNAHHDVGISGFTADVAKQVVEMLKPHGKIYITSERPLESDLEPYRLHINPADIHHVMAFASIYMGDSQSMAVEAAMLGVPSIRFNDFAGRIGVLEELEKTYQLTYGIGTNDPQRLYATIADILSNRDIRNVFQARRQKMLADKIDVTAFFTWFIENYPASVEQAKNADDNFWQQFK